MLHSKTTNNETTVLSGTNPVMRSFCYIGKGEGQKE